MPDLSRQETRDAECVERWPECESGAYDPRCCRFPKSCSCETAYRQETREAREAQIEAMNLALDYVPLSLYDEVRKLAEYAWGEVLAERDRLAAEVDSLKKELEELRGH